MSFKRVDTPGDLLRFRCWLKVECTACHAARTLNPREIVLLTGHIRTLAQLEKRLVCSRCKKKAARLVVLPPL